MQDDQHDCLDQAITKEDDDRVPSGTFALLGRFAAVTRKIELLRSSGMDIDSAENT